MSTVPYARLGIPEEMRKNLSPDAPRKVKAAIAQGLVPVPPQVQLAICYVLATDEDRAVAKRARKTLADMPTSQVLAALSPNTHPKILEFLAEKKKDKELYQRLIMMKNINDRTACIIARRADAELAEMVGHNQERLLMTPEVYVELYNNPQCPDVLIERMKGFLQLQGELPEVPAERPKARRKKKKADTNLDSDAQAALEAELDAMIVAAVRQEQADAPSDDLEAFQMTSTDEDFSFDFKDEMHEFSYNVVQELNDSLGDEERLSMEKYINSLTTGKKVKLAYKGNIEARKILVRDRNKLVSCAVIKSGRCTDNEIASYAGNRNLDREVIRLISSTPEFIRKYPVRVALCNNSKTPPAIALQFIKQLTKRDLQAMTRNRNVGGNLQKQSKTLFKRKFQGQKD